MGTTAPALTLSTGCNKLQIAEIPPTSSQRIKICCKSRVQPAHLITQAHQCHWRLSELSPCHLALCWMLPFPSQELTLSRWDGAAARPKGSKPSSFLGHRGRRKGHRSHSQLPPPRWCKISSFHRASPDSLWAPSASVSPLHVPLRRDLLGSSSASSVNPSLQNTQNT